jgi:disulfide bond formation protein DsbB
MSIYYKIINDFLKIKVFYIVAFISFSTVLTALYIDYFLEFDPCPLCIYQRVPYFIASFFSVAGMILNSKFSKLLLQILILVFISGASISVYHLGIERSWWSPSKMCKPEIRVGENTSLEEFKIALDHAPIGDCSKPAITIFNFSLAEINSIFSFCLIFYLVRVYTAYEKTTI